MLYSSACAYTNMCVLFKFDALGRLLLLVDLQFAESICDLLLFFFFNWVESPKVKID